MGTALKHRRGSSLALVSENPILEAGELCFDTDANLFKIGDGTTPWLELPFIQNPLRENSVYGNIVADYSLGIDKLARAGEQQASAFLATNGYFQPIEFKPATNYFYYFAQYYANTDTARRILGAQQNVGAIWRYVVNPSRNAAAVAYGNRTFVFVADSGSTRVGRSGNGGITWTYHASANDSNTWVAVAFGGGKFVAVASSGSAARAMYSTNNGATWTLGTVPAGVSTATWSGVTYGNGVFVAVASNGFVMSSTDGITWTQRTASAASVAWQAVAYGADVFVAVANSGSTRCMSSSDGVTWTSRTISSLSYTGIAYGGGGFIAAATGTTTLSRSFDGISWTTLSANFSAGSRLHVSFGGGKYVIARTGSNNYGQGVSVSEDGGRTWFTPTPTSTYTPGNDLVPYSSSLRAACYGAGVYVMVGNNMVWTSGAFNPDGELENVPTGTTTYARQYSGWVSLGNSALLNTGTTSGTVAAGDHAHGNITTDGKIGSTANQFVVTTTAGVLTTAASVVTPTLLVGTAANTRVDVSSNAVLASYYSTEANPRFVLDRDLLGSGKAAAGFNIGGSSTMATNGVAVGYAAARELGLYTSNGTALTERVRVDNNGNVGIGTDDPGYKLEVNGSLAIGATSAYTFSGNAWGYDKIVFRQDVNNKITSDANGNYNWLVAGKNWTLSDVANVGIGILTPGSKLVVKGAGITSAASALDVTDSTDASLLFVRNDGNVGVGTNAPGYKLEVNGSFAATTKSFRIAHPSKPNHILEYGSLESPYHGVRLTGRGVVTESRGEVRLPEYLKDLVNDDETLTIQITNYRHGKLLYVSAIDLQHAAFFVACDLSSDTPLEFFWSLTAVRKDVAPMVVEQEG